MTASTPSTSSAGDAPADDVIDRLAGIAAESSLAALRAQRPETARFAQSSYLALLEPADPAGVSWSERHLLALFIAQTTATLPLVAWHQARLRQLGVAEATLSALMAWPAGGDWTARQMALLAFTDRLTREPVAARQADIAALMAAGLTPAEVVTVAQLIGFMSYQLRVLAGLRLLTEPTAASPLAALRHGAVPGDTPYLPFTLEEVGWRPWVPTVDDVGPTPEQAALVEQVSPRPSGRPYYALLAHDAPVLVERTALMRSAMYSQGGLRRAERELSAVATSRFNGCPYCASVHARLYVQLTKDEALIRRLLDQGLDADLPERERAVVDLAVGLTRDPVSLAGADLAASRAAGLTDLEIYDLTQVVAMFAWANRLLQTLGEPEIAPSPVA